MWWFRTLSLLACAVVLAACGFRPLYGNSAGSEASADLASVGIAPIADRIGQQLHNHLLELINPRGRPLQPRYTLRVRLSEGIEHLAVRKSELSTRANLRLVASFSLSPAGGATPLVEGSSVVVSSYNILKADFATLIAEKDARARAAREIAQDIRARLAVFFLQQKSNGIPTIQ
jgi:LPS-assembly lipoprotein